MNILVVLSFFSIPDKVNRLSTFLSQIECHKLNAVSFTIRTAHALIQWTQTMLVIEPNPVGWKDIFSTLNSAKKTYVFRLLTIHASKA